MGEILNLSLLLCWVSLASSTYPFHWHLHFICSAEAKRGALQQCPCTCLMTFICHYRELGVFYFQMPHWDSLHNSYIFSADALKFQKIIRNCLNASSQNTTLSSLFFKPESSQIYKSTGSPDTESAGATSKSEGDGGAGGKVRNQYQLAAKREIKCWLVQQQIKTEPRLFSWHSL